MTASEHLEILRQLVTERLAGTRRVIEEDVSETARDYAFRASGGRNLLLYLQDLTRLEEKLVPERLYELTAEDLAVSQALVSFAATERRAPTIRGRGTLGRQRWEETRASRDRDSYRAAGEWLSSTVRPILGPLGEAPVAYSPSSAGPDIEI